MKFIKILKPMFFCVCLAFVVVACNDKKAAEGTATESDVNSALGNEKELPKITEDEVGYAFGVIIAQAVKEDGLKLNQKSILKGFNAAMAKNASAKEVEKAKTILNQAYSIAQKEKAAKNLEEAHAFMEKNKSKEGVAVTESGLQYEILKDGGNVNKPKDNDEVEVNYTGVFSDGTVFDDSSKAKTPVKIHLSRVIPGWKEGLQLMSPGSKYKFYVPPELAYGAQGISQGGSWVIPPNAVLIFEVELVRILVSKEPPIKK